MSRLRAFIRRDWLIRASYRTSFLVNIGQIVFTLATFFFISKLVDPRQASVLAPYGGGYFPFVLLGLVGSRYLAISLSGVAGNLRDEQLQGTLEAILTTPIRLPILLLGSASWALLWTTLEVLAYLGIGALLFGVDLSRMNVSATIVLLVLSVVSLSSLGALAACGVLLFKEFDPVNWMLEGAMKLAGGVYFPVSLLPTWCQPLVALFPLTYALEGLRQAVLTGRSLAGLSGVCVVLAGFGVVLWPLALISFSWTLKRLKTTGAVSFR